MKSFKKDGQSAGKEKTSMESFFFLFFLRSEMGNGMHHCRAAHSRHQGM
jgi:hypothetical protein